MSELFERILTRASKKAGNMGKQSQVFHLEICGLMFPRRGKSGGQVRDEYRDEYDPGRGGFGRAVDAERVKEEEEYGKGR